ncbi:mitochondrial amidoxime reducing component 2-like [Harpegnathos saltator]|uniref:mitochondrial amidoxime reducing component 2-like n=1 Tax=Harpegnathos saltator TaxID=610380 RepID=UPI00058CE8DC|nr:mitochondrial amidoxime reducing component 2-like [Harpegnathos saltator]
MNDSSNIAPLDEEFKNNYSWLQVGTVTNVSLRPVISGNTTETDNYLCKSIGLTGWFGVDKMTELRKDMIVIYDQENNCIQENEPNINLQNLIIEKANNLYIYFMAPGMCKLAVDMFDQLQNLKIVQCKMSFCKKYVVEVKCIDCGNEAAEWISKYLNKPTLRLAYALIEPETPSYFWHQLKQAYRLEPDERNIVIPFNTIPRYTLLSHQSLIELSKVSSYHNDQNHFSPDICFTPLSTIPFIEFEWEWIMVGKAIMRNVKPWDSSILDPKQMPMDMKMNLMLLHCEIYQPGSVRTGDSVYVSQPLTDNTLDTKGKIDLTLTSSLKHSITTAIAE